MGTQVGKAGIGFSICLGIEKLAFIFSDSFGHQAQCKYPGKFQHIDFDFYLVPSRKSKFRRRTNWGQGIVLADSAMCGRAFYIQHDQRMVFPDNAVGCYLVSH
tara:strand:- start:1990 stop:2298 length:309 start_codon:yes stop_codon:yes gene_type:complete